MKKLICIFLIAISLQNFCYAAKVDSLFSLLKSTKKNHIKVDVLNELFFEYEFSDTIKAKDFLKRALYLSKKSKYVVGTANTYEHLAYYAEDNDNFNDAFKNYTLALNLFRKLNNQKSVGHAQQQIGILFFNRGNYPEALKYFFTSLKIREAIKDKQGIAACYNNIGLVYENQGEHTDALKNQLLSVKINNEINDRIGAAISYNNIGIIYKHQNKLEPALENYTMAHNIAKEIDYPELIIATYNNLGIIQYDKGNYKEALENYAASLKLVEAMGDKSRIAGSYINMGNVYTRQKQYSLANTYLNKAKEIAKEIGQKEFLKDVYLGLSTLQTETKEFENALKNHLIYIRYRDSLDNESTQKKTIQNQMTYEFEKKEAVSKSEYQKSIETERVIANEKSRKQNIITVFIAGGLLLVLIFAGFIFRSLRTTRKQKSIIELQKLEVELQKHMVEEKQREVMDSIHYAKRIQHALLPNEKQLEKIIKRLNT